VAVRSDVAAVDRFVAGMANMMPNTAPGCRATPLGATVTLPFRRDDMLDRRSFVELRLARVTRVVDHDSA